METKIIREAKKKFFPHRAHCVLWWFVLLAYLFWFILVVIVFLTWLYAMHSKLIQCLNWSKWIKSWSTVNTNIEARARAKVKIKMLKAYWFLPYAAAYSCIKLLTSDCLCKYWYIFFFFALVTHYIKHSVIISDGQTKTSYKHKHIINRTTNRDHTTIGAKHESGENENMIFGLLSTAWLLFRKKKKIVRWLYDFVCCASITNSHSTAAYRYGVNKVLYWRRHIITSISIENLLFA